MPPRRQGPYLIRLVWLGWCLLSAAASPRDDAHPGLDPLRITGGAAELAFGCSVRAAGDVNGDGFADVIVGAKYSSVAAHRAGRVSVYHGSRQGLRAEPEWVWEGDQAGAELGYAADGAGDVNGDGFADVVVGAFRYSERFTNAGRVYLFLGSSSGLGRAPAWIADGDQPNAQLGVAVAPAGDVNGDGFADVILGAWRYRHQHPREGRAYVFYGSRDGLGGTASWSVGGTQEGEELGYAVGGAGDVNGDGFDDVIIGAHRYSGTRRQEGRASLYLGSSTGLTEVASWTAVGGQEDACFGESVGRAGDVNGDGLGDLVVGAFTYDDTQVDAGRVFVFHGSRTAVRSTPDWTASGGALNARFGFACGTAGDVDGDGFADLIIGAFTDHVETDGGRAYLFLGSRRGLRPAPHWIGRGGRALASYGMSVGTAGDINGDALADVLVGAPAYDATAHGEGAVWLYPGSREGWRPAVAGPPDVRADLQFLLVAGGKTGPRPSAVAAADFDRDGQLDVAVASEAEHQVAVFLGHGDASFGPPRRWRVGKDPLGLVARDLDGDGMLDLAVACHKNTVSVLPGDGRGGFGPVTDHPVPWGPVALVAGDFTGDGRVDLAVLCEAAPQGHLLRGLERGGFVAAEPFPVRHEPHAAVPGDFNRDGQLDLAITDINTTGVSILAGTRAGRFEAPVRYAVGLAPRSVAAGDLNHDGYTDLVTANLAGNTVTLLLGQADGTFQRANDFWVPGNPAAVAITDFDGDQNPDLATANGATESVSVLRGHGDGSFENPVEFPVGPNPVALAVGDYNADGQPDLAVIHGRDGAFSILLNHTRPGAVGPGQMVLGLLPHWVLFPLGAGSVGVAAATGLVVRYFSLRRARRRIRELELQTAVAQERARIARDLHDDLGADLSRIAILSERLRLEDLPPAATRSQLEAIAASSRDMVENIRELVWAADPHNDLLENLAAYLREYVANLIADAGLRADLDFAEDLPALRSSSEYRRNVFLAVKEAVGNVLKHARANAIEIRFHTASGWLEIRVADDGQGFDASAVGPFHNGLRNMRERVEALGGTLTVAAKAGHGTKVHLRVPLPPGGEPSTQGT